MLCNIFVLCEKSARLEVLVGLEGVVLSGLLLSTTLGLISVARDGGGQLGRDGTQQVAVLVAVLEEEEGGDGSDTKLKGEVGDIVGVELGESELLRGVLIGLLLEDGGDGLARTAPRGVGLEGDVGGVLDELVELSLGGDVHNGRRGGHFDRGYVRLRFCVLVGDESLRGFGGGVEGIDLYKYFYGGVLLEVERKQCEFGSKVKWICFIYE